MSVNGITGVTGAYPTTSETATAKNAESVAEKKTAADNGVVYEPSSKKATDSDSTKVTDYSSIVA